MGSSSCERIPATQGILWSPFLLFNSISIPLVTLATNPCRWPVLCECMFWTQLQLLAFPEPLAAAISCFYAVILAIFRNELVPTDRLPSDILPTELLSHCFRSVHQPCRPACRSMRVVPRFSLFPSGLRQWPPGGLAVLPFAKSTGMYISRAHMRSNISQLACYAGFGRHVASCAGSQCYTSYSGTHGLQPDPQR